MVASEGPSAPCSFIIRAEHNWGRAWKSPLQVWPFAKAHDELPGRCGKKLNKNQSQQLPPTSECKL